MATLWPCDRQPQPIGKLYKEMTPEERFEDSLSLYRHMVDYYNLKESDRKKEDKEFDKYHFPRREEYILQYIRDPNYDPMEEFYRQAEQINAADRAQQERHERLLAPSPPATPPRSSDGTLNQGLNLPLSGSIQASSGVSASTAHRTDESFDGPSSSNTDMSMMPNRDSGLREGSKRTKTLDWWDDLQCEQLPYDADEEYPGKWDYDKLDTYDHWVTVHLPPTNLPSGKQIRKSKLPSSGTAPGPKSLPSRRMTRSLSKASVMFALGSDGKSPVTQAPSPVPRKSSRLIKNIEPKPLNRVSGRSRISKRRL